tara:strand:+ start:459 stop:623 length:165 start_codon:yes stop_codon:yes gene_type:complete
MKTQEELIEDMQELIILAGGRFFRKAELENMTLKGWMKHFNPNGLHLEVYRVKK